MPLQEITNGTNGDLKSFLKTRSMWFNSVAFGLLEACFYLQLQKWPHIANQFNFTQSDSDFFLTYYVLGFLFASTLFPYSNCLLTKPRLLLTLLFLLTLAFLSTIMGTFLIGNVGLTTFIAFGLGFSLSSQLILTLTLSFTQGLKSAGMHLMCGGVLAAVLTGVGDKIHYMNRDINTWIYVAEGIVATMVVLAYTANMLTVRWQ